MKRLLVALLLLISSTVFAGGPDVGYPSAEDINTAVSSLTTALASKPSAPVSIANGGTGQTASSSALTALGGAASAQPAWIPMTGSYLSSWVDVGGGTQVGSYYKDTLGIVHLAGGVKDGTVGDFAMFVLPAGYRPSSGLHFFPAVSNNAFGAVLISGTTGAVECYVGNNASFYLDGISFRAEN